MNTKPFKQSIDGKRRRRTHSVEFKAKAVAACRQPGMSVAAVAMAVGVHATLLRCWVREAQRQPGIAERPPLVEARTSRSIAATAFIPMTLPALGATPDICLELRQGATSIMVRWPTAAAGECAAWMRELLR